MEFITLHRLSYLALGATAYCFTLVAWKSSPHAKPFVEHFWCDTIPVNTSTAQNPVGSKPGTKKARRSFSDLSASDWQKIAEKIDLKSEEEKQFPCSRHVQQTEDLNGRTREKLIQLEKGRRNINGN